MTHFIKILSIDGGGIRGIIPATLLAEVERRTQHPISEMFDLMAGTSTGGMLALALNVPSEDGHPRYSAEILPALYETYSMMIFRRTRWEAVLAMDNWRQRRYPNTGIAEALHDLFEDMTLRDTITDVLITSYDIEKRLPHFFRSSRARTDDSENFYLRDVVRATTAAPTFFEPARVVRPHDDPETYHALIDGSMTSINPALAAYVEARETYPDAEDFMVLSLGTGNLTQPLPYQEVRRWGLLDWARPLTDIMFDGTSRTVDYQMQQLLARFEDGTNRYFRLQKRIEGYDHRMDDVSADSLELIHQWAKELIDEQDETIDIICEILTRDLVEAPPPPTPRLRRRIFSLTNLAFWRRRWEQAADATDNDDSSEVAQTG